MSPFSPGFFPSQRYYYTPQPHDRLVAQIVTGLIEAVGKGEARLVARSIALLAKVATQSASSSTRLLQENKRGGRDRGGGQEEEERASERRGGSAETSAACLPEELASATQTPPASLRPPPERDTPPPHASGPPLAPANSGRAAPTFQKTPAGAAGAGGRGD